MTQWRLAAAWVIAAAVATTLAWQIVSLADDRVGGSISAPLEISSPSLSPPTTHDEPTTTHDEPTATSSSTTSTTTSPPTTSPGGELLTIPTVGGKVTVRVSDGAISYVSAVPAFGFVVEVDDPGPPEVRIDLISVATEVEIRVRWRNGQAEVRVDVD